METGEVITDATLMAKDGHPVPFLLTGVKFETQEQTYLMRIGIDTSWRKQAEDQPAGGRCSGLRAKAS